MGMLSKNLKAYLSFAAKKHGLAEPPPVKVVVKLKKPLPASLLHTPRSLKTQANPYSHLKKSGFTRKLMQVSSVTPKVMLEGQDTVTLKVDSHRLARLAKMPQVKYVRTIRIHHMHLDTSVALLGIDASVRSRYSGKGITVAVIDSGIDVSHPDLKGRVLLSKSRNFTSDGSTKDVSDGHGHGTHVAGIIGGSGGNYKGVAPAVRFIACKVFDSRGGAEEGAVMEAVRWAVKQGADIINYSGGWAPIQDGIVLVKPPWVWPAKPVEEEKEFIRAMGNGVVCVVSAGNEGAVGRCGTLSMPATTPAVISVGSVDKELKLSGFSSVGPAFRSNKVSEREFPKPLTPSLLLHTTSFPEVDVLAPGGEFDPLGAQAGGCYYLPGIISAQSSKAPKNKACLVTRKYTRVSGTSQAAPHVAGLAALILEATNNLALNPSVNRARAVKGILKEASRRLPGYNENEQGSGLPHWGDIDEVLMDLQIGKIKLNNLI